MDDVLTLDKLREVLDAIMPIQYYADAPYITRGKVFFSKSDGFFPDLIILNPDDLDELKRQTASLCRLLHIREWQPTSDDMAKYAKKELEKMAEEPMIFRSEWEKWKP